MLREKNKKYILIGITSLAFLMGFILPVEAMGTDLSNLISPLTPTIDSISPNPAKKGLEEVTFIGHSTEISGVTIAGYKWSSSIDGVLSTEATFKISTLSKGEHTISFGVLDNAGKWSLPATATLNITEWVIAPPMIDPTPTATVDSVSPNPAPYGQAVTFNGHGGFIYSVYGAAAEITAYEWRSSRDGVLSTQASFTSSTLSIGTHTIYFKVKSGIEVWSPEVTTTLTIANIPPTATIDSISPNPAKVGYAVTFTGHGGYIYPPGVAGGPAAEITAYNWRSSINNSISTQATFTTSSLSIGTHTIYFKVMDSYGAWSPEVSTTFLAIANTPPTVTIDSITPNPSLSGSDFAHAVEFLGRCRDADGRVTAYNWRSSIDGILLSREGDNIMGFGDIVGFHTGGRALTPGIHTIYFSARDNDGAWSEVTSTLKILGPPTATIDSISPNPFMQGEIATFRGHGTDADGSITAYKWRSSQNDFSSTKATFTISWPFTGEHIVYFSVQDNDGLWSPEVTAILTVTKGVPTATIDSISPNPAQLGQTLTFTGHGGYTNNLYGPGDEVTFYEWRSSINGVLSTQASFTSSSLSIGAHTIYFKVKNGRNDGVWSNEVTTILTILRPPTPPTATIESIAPNFVVRGEQVTFRGYGTDTGGSITAYEWRSSIDGVLSTQASFTTSTLSPGAHTVYLKVKDNDEMWSPEVSGSLTVYRSKSQNLLINPDFERGNFTGWTAWSYAYTNVSSAKPQSGIYHASNTAWSGAYQIVNVTPGRKYRLTGWVYSPSGNVGPYAAAPAIALAFNQKQQDGGQINGIVAYASLHDTYQLLSTGWVTAPSDAVYATISFHMSGNLTPPYPLYYDNFEFVVITELPTATIDSVTPNPVAQGQAVSFIGHGADADGSITAYEWRSSIDGLLSAQASFTSSILSVGAHTIYFKVKDNEGALSDEVTTTVTIKGKPTAAIDEIIPNPARFGQTLTFTGHGSYAYGASGVAAEIHAYEWRSSIDGVLSTQASFTSSTISNGVHTIYFKVKDGNGVWSDEVTTVLTITETDVEPPPPEGEGIITIKDGYFWDTIKNDYWLPHGIAYQTWNRPLGVWQTPEQIEYDLAEMEKAHVNSIRVDFVWKHIEEKGDNIFDWANYDMLLEKAKAHNIRVFALIGYQWPPDWFQGNPGQEEADSGWYTMHPPGQGPEGDPVFHTRRYTSDIISFEDPQARAQYTEFLTTVAARYKDNPAIAGWIVGNEYGYLGLWSGKQDGYDADCENAFRNWLSNYYGIDINKLNSVWGTTYSSFSQVVMPETYNRDNPAWWDLVQWREDSAANFVAIGAKAVKTADPNHLISYATVGMQWGEEDWRYHAEDGVKIVKACRDLGTPLDFWSINNYPWALLGHESQTGQWGVVAAKWRTGLPVLYTETGFTSSETMYPGLNEQNQGPLIRNALWEALETGAIGVHVFHWNDRKYITDREKGFGIVYPDRRVKPAFWVIRDTYNLMDQIDATHLFASSTDPAPDVAFYWSDATDQMYNRYEVNMQQIYGPLERLGLEPTFINREQLLAGEYAKYKAIILPRNMRMHSGDLNFIRTTVIPAGVHVYADADLPGMQDYRVQPLSDFVNEVKQIFGIDPTDTSGYDDPVENEGYGVDFTSINLNVTQNLFPLTSGRIDTFRVWKYSNMTVPATGTVYATHANGNPALVIKDHAVSKAAITTFSLGDIKPDGDGNGQPDIIPWAQHYDWFKAIFLTGFGIQPTLNLTGSQYVLADYRTTKDGSVLISFKNYRNDASQTVTLTTNLINGKTVENLTKGGIIETDSDGVISITLSPDDHQIVYAYMGTPPERVRILDARAVVVPIDKDAFPGVKESYPVKVRYDTQGKTLKLKADFRDSTTIYASSNVVTVTGAGEQELWVYIPEANFADSGYKSTPEGGKYYFKASLTDSSGTKVAQGKHETQLLWGIKPTTLPTNLTKGTAYDINVRWEGLPEYLSWEKTPLFREEALPGRVLVYKSSKTQAFDPTHYTRFNEVCAWLESLGYQRAELGIWEPVKGYYILTDADTGTDGKLLDLNWGYLKEFYSTVILPSVYVMNDNETANLIKYLENSVSTVISTDGSVGFRKPNDELTKPSGQAAGLEVRLGETVIGRSSSLDNTVELGSLATSPDGAGSLAASPAGADGSGRIEGIFGVGTGNSYLPGLNNLTVTDNSHYITKDYSNGTAIAANASTYARAWTVLTTGKAIATITNGVSTVPALISNKYGSSGSKAFVFNFGIDNYNQFTGNFNTISQRTDEWANREIYKVKWQLKYPTAEPNDGDLVVSEVEHWTMDGTGSTTLSFKAPSISMAADNLYWVGFVYPSDAADPWASQKGFYTSLNDPGYDKVKLSGPGLQIIGTSSYVHAGRSWDVWEAYNTRGATYALNLAFKEKGDNGDGTSNETYSSMTQSVNGLKEAIQYFGWVLDYNPAYNDYKSSTKGGKYQWSTSFTGMEGTSDFEVKLYFAPRLKVEFASFPKNIIAGSTVSVPIEWEELPEVPAKMDLILQNAYTGIIYAKATYTLNKKTDSGNFDITVPLTTPIGSNYLWSAYTYPYSATEPFNARYGLDDTFNYDEKGNPTGPETMINVGADYVLYSDAGIPGGAEVFTWKSEGANVYYNGNATGISVPEGVKWFNTVVNTQGTWAGWGIIHTSGTRDLSAYANGYLKFWVNRSYRLKIEIEAPQGRNSIKYLEPSPGGWEEITIPISDFAGIDLTQVYSPFKITAETGPSSFGVDLVRWTRNPEEWTLVWSDEFNNAGSIDTTKWTADVGRGPDGSDCWGTSSLQYYTDRPENIKVEDGNLVIAVRKEDYAGYPFTSAHISTRGKVAPIKYGRIAARIKLPGGYGMWPGFLMYGDSYQMYSWPENNWPACGEIDIMEMRGGNINNSSDGTIMGTTHWKNSSGTSYPSWWSFESGSVSLPGTQKFSGDFHEFEIVWNEQQIIWRLDGREYFSQNITSPDQTEFHEPFNIEINCMVGGVFFYPRPTISDITNAGTLFPQAMLVDWVRVYQLK